MVRGLWNWLTAIEASGFRNYMKFLVWLVFIILVIHYVSKLFSH